MKLAGLILIISNIFALVPVYAQGTVEPSEFVYPGEMEPSEFIYPTEEEIIEVEEIELTELNGKILKIENSMLTLETDEGTKVLEISQELAITRNSMEATIEEIKPGDKASVKLDEDGELISLDVTSENVMDIGKTMMLIIPLAGVIILLILSIVKKAKKPHIKTTSE